VTTPALSNLSDFLFGILQVLDVPPHPPRNRRHQQDTDDEIETVKEILERGILVPLLAQSLPNIGQAYAPWQRSRKGVDDEFF